MGLQCSIPDEGGRLAALSRPSLSTRSPTVMRQDLTTLRLFLAVVEARSMAHAAEREHITPPAVSKRIAELESELDVVLFERQRTGIRTTAAGEALAAEVRHVFHALERM